MGRWIIGIAFVIAGAAISAGVGALARPPAPQAICSLPDTPIPCLDDTACMPLYAAVCDVQMGQCVCVPLDGGTTDLAGVTDLALDGGGGVDATPSSIGPIGGPVAGGGGTAPAREDTGCSYVPGRAY
jgi:hypothetical protein